MTKKTITKRTWKLLLGICIAAVLSIGIGLFAYIHMIDTKTLGRKISIYGLDVSKLTAEKAQQKINEAFHNKNIIFHEDGEDVYSVSMAQLGYSLEQDSLRNELETLQQERSQDFRLFASEKDYTIDYQIIKNENQEKTALAAENFDNKERTESADAHIRYSKKKKKYIYAKPDETAENILQRDFYATVPNQKWATDVTEFKVPGEKKKLYLSAIIDLYDRYPVAYVVSARNDNRLIFKTFDKAIAANPDAKPIFHSDRGFQYTSKTFKKKLENQEMEQSMSRVGHCIDNGPIEGFWGIIKSEMYQMYEIIDEVSLRYAIKDYLRFYSEERPQDRYGCKTPSEVRQEALSSDVPTEYPIPENKRISKYKEKWCA